MPSLAFKNFIFAWPLKGNPLSFSEALSGSCNGVTHKKALTGSDHIGFKIVWLYPLAIFHSQWEERYHEIIFQVAPLNFSIALEKLLFVVWENFER